MEFMSSRNLLPSDLQQELTVTVEGHPTLPEGDYTFHEAFCREPGCDCRRVQFWVTAEGGGEVLAFITYAWEPRDYYIREWGYPADGAGLILGPELEPMAVQSSWAPALLVVCRLLMDERWKARIRENYFLFKGAVDEAAGWNRQPLRRAKVPRNAPCSCGSGRKSKRCCARRAS